MNKEHIGIFILFGNQCDVPSFGGSRSMLEVSVTEDYAWKDYWDKASPFEQRPWMEGEANRWQGQLED